MNIVLIKGGKVEIRKENGLFMRTIGNGDAVFANQNEKGDPIVTTTTNGKVEIRNDLGSLVSTIGSQGCHYGKVERREHHHHRQQRQDRNTKGERVVDPHLLTLTALAPAPFT